MSESEQTPPVPGSRELLTAAQLAEKLQCCYHTVNARAKNGEIPFVQLGTSPRHRRYVYDDVIAALKAKGESTSIPGDK